MYSLNDRNYRSVTINKFYQQQISFFFYEALPWFILRAQAGSTKISKTTLVWRKLTKLKLNLSSTMITKNSQLSPTAAY